MNNKYWLISLALISSLTATPSIFANQPLENLGNNYFKDQQGRVIYYPCTMGGEPLVIYSSVDNQPISSKANITPAYLKEGYQASPIYIADFETSDVHSRINLVVQTTNPAFSYMSIDLNRQDGATFYVDTANFPVVESFLSEGSLQKFVSQFNVSINNSQDIYKGNGFPVYNYNFAQSQGLYVYTDVSQITANVASWNQNSKWTNGKLGRNLSNINYRFAPLKVVDAGITSYDGFGFWICGSDKKTQDHTIGKQKTYMDKAR